jgi:hypothetical protein
MRLQRKENGSVFIISLVMLVLLTLIAVSAIQGASGMLQIVGNSQFREEGVAAATQGIDQLVGSVTPTVPLRDAAAAMNTNGSAAIDINGDGTVDYPVVFTPLPTCLSRSDAKDYIPLAIQAQRAIADLNKEKATPAQQTAYDTAMANIINLATCRAGEGMVAQCLWSLWRVTAQVKDPFTGVNVTVTQGVRVLVGTDTALNSCT